MASYNLGCPCMYTKREAKHAMATLTVAVAVL